MYKRELRTRFDLLKPDVSQTVETRQRAQIVARRGNRKVSVNVGDDVMIDNFGMRNEKRVQGTIIKQMSPSTYAVKTDQDIVQKRHKDQISKPPLRRSPRLNPN